ncbi:L-rhamnose mutarotase [Planctomycetota bacterium]
MTNSFKRYCKTLKLENNPELIADYKKAHGLGQAWPEVTQGMKDVGILGMEIYIADCQLFMIMDTVADFDHDQAMTKLGTLPRQSEWEAHMSRFQKTDSNASADEKWILLERIYEMDQRAEYQPQDGYMKETY